VSRQKDLPNAPIRSRRAAFRGAIIGPLLVVLSSAGCGGLPAWRPSRRAPPSDAAEAATGRSEVARPAASRDPDSRSGNRPADSCRQILARDGWIHALSRQAVDPIHAPRPPERLGARPDLRWRYPDLDDLLAGPEPPRADLRTALDDRDPTVATNAAIGLARLGDAAGIDQLGEGVRTPNLKLPIRQAAAEALGRIAEPSPVEPLRALLDQYGPQNERGPNGATHPIPELHAELIRGLAAHVDPADDPRFLEALTSPAAEVRREALLAWSAGRHGTLSVEAVDLRTDPDPRVRAVALACLAQRRHPQAPEYLAAALNDRNLQVRIAAVAALGALGGSEAQQTLEQLLDDPGEVIRAGAVAALATAGAPRTVLEAADDKSWRVRLEVARALADHSTPAAATTARRLIDDPSSAVQCQTIASVAGWPREQAGPILLAGLEKASYTTRREAARHLAVLWPEAAEFPVDGPPERRAEVLARLRDRLRDEIGRHEPAGPDVPGAGAVEPAVPPVSPQTIAYAQGLVAALSAPGIPEPARRQSIASLRGLGPELVATLEQLSVDRGAVLPEAVYRDVLPPCAPVFRALDRLVSEDVAARRAAARELAKLAGRRPLGRLAVARLAAVALVETDSLVWQGVLDAIAVDSGEPAARLACAAIRHPSPEVRRRACEHLAAHGGLDRDRTALLREALHDESPLVVRAAVRALAARGRVEETDSIKRLLLVTDERVCLEAATALCRLGDPSGPPALERLSYSADHTVRREVARTMGQIGDPSLAPSLVRLLDDQHDVRTAALEALPQVVGRDVAEVGGGSPPSVAERVESWKRWHRHEHDGIRRASPDRASGPTQVRRGSPDPAGGSTQVRRGSPDPAGGPTQVRRASPDPAGGSTEGLPFATGRAGREHDTNRAY